MDVIKESDIFITYFLNYICSCTICDQLVQYFINILFNSPRFWPRYIYARFDNF